MKRTYLLLTAAAMVVVPAMAMASGCQPTSATKVVDVKSENQSVILNTDVVLLSLIHISEPTRPY